jgi:heterodisulfide reductase subunit A
MSQDPRVGVYICHCGSNIAGTVDVADVSKWAGQLPNVVVSRDYKFMCSSPGQEMIGKDIQENNLNRVVVASCSPHLHEPTFRNACARAGLNPYLFEMANIREQDTWVHSHEPAGALEKAKDLVASAVAKSHFLTPLDMIKVPVTKTAMVIGGGVAGISSALDLADMGIKTYLVEREPSIGGRMAQLNKTFPTMDCSI